MSDTSSLCILSALNHASSFYDQATHPGLVLPNGHQYGLIAEELDNTLPQHVRKFLLKNYPILNSDFSIGHIG